MSGSSKQALVHSLIKNLNRTIEDWRALNDETAEDENLNDDMTELADGLDTAYNTAQNVLAYLEMTTK